MGVSSEIQRNLLKRSQQGVHSVMAILIELQPLIAETSKRIYQSYGLCSPQLASHHRWCRHSDPTLHWYMSQDYCPVDPGLVHIYLQK